MARRHLILGGGTAAVNACRTIRETERERSEITLVAPERPYSRMVLPYYLDRSIAESHVYTATAAMLAAWGVTTHLGRRAARLEPAAGACTLDDGTTLAFDTCLVATGSSPVRAPVPGADGRGVHSFWTLEQARGLLAEIQPGSHVVMVGAGFISFTILNSILALGAKLTIVEIADRILPRMVDSAGAELIDAWLQRHGVAIRTGVRLTAIGDIRARGGRPARKKLVFAGAPALVADVVVMATGIRPNIDWLKGSGLRLGQGGILVDAYLCTSADNVFAAGDVAAGPDRLGGSSVVHAIEPTAQEHGRVAGANMAGAEVSYRGSLLMNIVEVCHLDVASFGAWDDAGARVASVVRADRPAYRKLLFTRDRLTGAIILGPSSDVWTTNDVGMLKGLVQSGVALGRWVEHLARHPFDVKPAYLACRTAGLLLPETLLGRPALAPGATTVAV